MTTPALAALLAIALSSPAAARDDKEALTQALSKVAALESYAFKGETEFQSALGNPPAQIPSMDGKYQKDAGLHIKSDRGEIFKKGDRVFVKQGSADWTDAAQFQPPAPAEGEKPNRNRARGALFGRMMLKNLKAPHEELAELAKGFKEVKKAEKAEKIGDVDCFQYAGDLSEEAMKGSPLGRMLAQFGAGANADARGSARVWLDAAGNVVIYEVVTRISVELQGNQVDFSMTRRSELSGAGATKVEVPEALRKLLSEKPKTEEKKE
jgi:hypothetical protein